MNPLRALHAPWIAAQKGQRWFAAFFYGLALLYSAAMLHAAMAPAPGGNPARTDAHTDLFLLVVSMVYIGALFPARSLLLMRDAHALRLPGAVREAAVGVCGIVLLAVAVPVALLGVAGAEPISIAIALLLSLGIGMLAALERIQGLWLLVLVWIGLMLSGRRLDDWVAQPSFVLYGGIAVALLAWRIVARWRYLLYLEDPAASGRNTLPLVFLSDIRWRSRFAYPFASRRDPAAASRNPRLPTRAAGNVAEIGAPGRMTALRVALGGWYRQRGAADRLRQILFFAVLVGMVVAASWLTRFDTPPGGRSPHIRVSETWPVVWLSMLAFANAIVAFHSVDYLRQRWQRRDAELPLLALLPGLGRSVKRSLLVVACGLPLAVEFALLLATLLIAGLTHVDAMQAGPVLALQLLGIGWIVALVPGIFASRPLTGIALQVARLCGLVLLLAIPHALLPPMPRPAPQPTFTLLTLLTLGASSLVLLVLLLARGCCGWRAFQRCPHPFLAR